MMGRNHFFCLFLKSSLHPQNDHGRFEAPDGAREKLTGYEPPADIPADKGDWKEHYPDYY